MTPEVLTQFVADTIVAFRHLVVDPATYLQLGLVTAAYILARLIAARLRRLVPALTNEPAAVNDVGHVSLPFVAFRGEQRLAKTAFDFRGIMKIEKCSPDAIFTHRANAMGNNEPAGLGFDGGAAGLPADCSSREDCLRT
jgi:hypothetical protein